LTELGRSARQAPLHGLRPAGIGAAGDDAEIGACLPERLLIDVGLGGSILDDARRLGATSELLAKEMQRALAALGRLCRLRPPDRRRGLTRLLAGGLALRFLDLVACLHNGAAAAFCDFGEVGRGPVRVGFERGERSIAGLGGGMTLVFPLSPDSSRSLARSRSTGELRF